MKTAFSILPARNENISLHLLIEAGNYGISFIWFTKAPLLVQGIAIYNGEANLHPQERENEIKNIFNSNHSLKHSFSSVTVCYNFKESVLVPEKYYNTAAVDETVALIYGEHKGAVIKNDVIKPENIYNLYRVHKNIDAFFSDKLPAAAFCHSTSLQLNNKMTDTYLHCIIFHNAIKVIFYKEGKLQIIQQFGYHTPADVAYHLLNICSQYETEAGSLPLYLSGMIDKDSNLYNELYKYFLNINFDIAPEAILSAEIKKYPPHFFSHLTALASCVS